MSTPEFPTYSHTRKSISSFSPQNETIGRNVSNENPQGTVTPIDWIPTSIGMGFTGKLGIGTASPSSTQSLTVVGPSTFSQNVYVVGILTALKLYGDGSGLTNLTGVGGGVQLRNNGTIVGSVGTVDFTGYPIVSIGAASGIATVFIKEQWSQTSAGINTLSNVGIGTTNPTSALTVIGTLKIGTGVTISSGVITDAKGEIRQIPRSTSSLLIASDAGKFVDSTGGVTINASTAFSVGDAVTIYNNNSVSATITASGITLRQAGTSNTGNRTLAAYGIATILCVATNVYVISGAGLT